MIRGGVMLLLLSRIVIFSIITLGLGAQETPPPESKPSIASKPLKNEEGDVSVDSNGDSVRLRETALSFIKKSKLTLENDNKKDVLTNYTDSFAQAATLYQKGNYIESRRSFQALVNFIEDNNAKQVERLKGLYDKYTQIAMKDLVEIKLNKDSGYSNLEKNVNNKLYVASLSYNDGNALSIRGKYTDSLYNYKNANREIFEALILMEKDKKTSELTLKDKKDKGLLTIDEILPKEYLKDYDDFNEVSHEKMTKERETAKAKKSSISSKVEAVEKQVESIQQETPVK